MASLRFLPTTIPIGPTGATGSTGAQGIQGPTGMTGPQGESGISNGRLMYLNYPNLNANNPSYYLMESNPTGGSVQTLTVSFTAGQTQVISFATDYQIDPVNPVISAGLWYTELNMYVGSSGQEFNVNVGVKAATGSLISPDPIGQSANSLVTATASTIYGFNTVIQSVDGIATDGYAVLTIEATNNLASPATLNLEFLSTRYSYSATTLSQNLPQGPTGAQGIQGSTGPTGAQGIQGPTGTTGAQGIQGSTGPRGATGPLGPTGSGGALGYYGSFYDTTTQYNTGGLGTVNKIRYNTTSEARGISIVDGTKVTFAYPGTYNIQFSVQVVKDDANQDTFSLWPSINGTNVPDSNTDFTLNTNNARSVAAWNFIFTLNANDFVELNWSSDDNQMYFPYIGPQTVPTRPAIPSVILTAQQVMYLQVGPTGSTGPTGPQGATGASPWATTGTIAYYQAGNVGIGTSGASSTLTIQGSTSQTGGSNSWYGDFNLNNYTLSNPRFASVKETTTAVTITTTGTILDCNTGNNWNITLTGTTGSFTFINAPATGTLQQMNIFVTQGGGGNKFLTYPSNISFGAQGTPTLSTTAGSIDVINFFTYSNGSKWLGFLAGKGF
jgi:collagen type VII alpha